MTNLIIIRNEDEYVEKIKYFFEQRGWGFYFIGGDPSYDFSNVTSINGVPFDPYINYLILIMNDYEYEMSFPNNVYVYRSSIHKSLRKKNEFILPFFYLNHVKYFNFNLTLKNSLEPVEKTNKPKICFCGAINTCLLRLEWLEYLKKSDILDKNFIYREGFRKGDLTSYIENLNTSEFCFCPRGLGNFSIRFYECIYYGRIPVVLDTDIILPFSNYIDWNKYIVISEKIEELPEKIYNFWKNNDIIEIQNELKNIFKKYFNDDKVSYYIYSEINNLEEPILSI